MRKIFYFTFFLTVFVFSACKDTKNNKTNTSESDTIFNLVNDSLKCNDSLLYNTGLDSIQNDSVRDALLTEASKVSAHGEIAKTEANKNFYADKSGIGVIKLGENIKNIPPKSEGLYDKKELISDGHGGRICLIYYKNEQIIEIDIDKNNIIKSIRITSPSIKTIDGISQFMDYKTLLKNQEFKKYIGKIHRTEMSVFELNGIRYELEENIKGDNKYVSAIIIGK